jgi:hypothetical protein
MFQTIMNQNPQALSATSTGIVLDGCTIQSVQRGSPAFYSEVDLVGQTITQVDLQPVDTKTLPLMLKGNNVPGGKVSLKLGTGQKVELVRDSAEAIKARAAVYEEIAEDDKGKRLLTLLEPFLKCDPWRPAQAATSETKIFERRPSRSLQVFPKLRAHSFLQVGRQAFKGGDWC